MAKIEQLTSKTKIKQRTSADVRNLGPIVQDYEEQESTALQTIINLANFSVQVDSNGVPNPEGYFALYIDGQKLRPGSSNDYYFTNISNGASTTITLTSSLLAGLNIIAEKLGVAREQFPSPSSVQATINNDIGPRLHGKIVTKSADYTIQDTDTDLTVLFDDTSSDRTCNLPAAANNTNKVITIKNISTDKGKVTVDGNGSETIDGYTTIDLDFKNCYIKIQSDGSNWIIIGENITSPQKEYTMTVTGTLGWSTVVSSGRPYRTMDGTWFLIFNIFGTITDTSAKTTYTATITGVTFTSERQAISATSTSTNAYIYFPMSRASNGNVQCNHASANTGAYGFSGDVKLASKPTFVE